MYASPLFRRTPMSAAATSCPDVVVPPGAPDQQEAVRRQIPSQRNREVFAAVAMGKSHTEVANEFGLTQPRVTQIMRQVREWSMQVAGGEMGEFNEVQRLRLAEETLRVQLDGWMRMAMGEWRRSRKEGLGRVTFLNAASRLASNLAKLAGVDVSGKTARLKAEQQAKEECELRRVRLAEKALWEAGQNTAEAPQPETESTLSTPDSAIVCKEQTAPPPAESLPVVPINNSYGPLETTVASEVAQTIKNRFTPSTPAVSVPQADKPDSQIPRQESPQAPDGPSPPGSSRRSIVGSGVRYGFTVVRTGPSAALR
jgi:hypothetical protein